MSKNTKNTKNTKRKNAVRKPSPTATAQKGPGRPKSEIKWPVGPFTRQMVYDLNPSVASLTIIKRMDAFRFMKDENGKIDRSRPRRNSPLTKIKGELGAPTNEKGLGRRPEMYLYTHPVTVTPPAIVISSVPAVETPAPVTVPVAEVPAEAMVDVGTSAAAENVPAGEAVVPSVEPTPLMEPAVA